LNVMEQIESFTDSSGSNDRSLSRIGDFIFSLPLKIIGH